MNHLPPQYRELLVRSFTQLPHWVTDLQPTWPDFDHPSEYHGLWHTNRVMMHVLLLGHAGGMDNNLIRRTYCAAVIHDQARRHDGWCTQHGAWSKETKLPCWTERFLNAGVTVGDLELIADAVEFHSKNDLPREHQSFATMALLKDADALDRFRLGPGELDPRYLRHDHTPAFITLAEALVDRFWEVERIEVLLEHVSGSPAVHG